MLEDLDRIMEEAGLDWIVARGYPSQSAGVAFLTAGARVGHSTILKRRGEAPHFVVGAMERDEARRAGLKFTVPNDYGAATLSQQDVTPLELGRRVLRAILEKHEVSGRVSFVGSGSIQSTFPLLTGVLEAMPQITYVEEGDGTAVGRARFTKSEAEIERIRSVARRTEEVVGLALDLVRSARPEGGILTRAGGSPLKIGHVKDLIRLELARRSLDDHGETIFAAGREAGFPHSRGDESAPVPVGRTIIFDIFPQERGGGFFYDMTRTYWVGEVADAVREAYDAVREAFVKTAAAARAGQPTRELDELACDVLEGHGHVTKRSDPLTCVGYMHSLGHGVGLEIHERPFVTTRAANRDVFAPGMVFTIEPGLYYPDQEMGIRIEDTFVLTGEGRAESLSTLPTDAPCIQIQPKA